MPDRANRIILAHPLKYFEPPKPVVVQLPAPTEAAMYFFRPSFDKVAANERPTLVIDGHPVGRLGASEFLRVSMTPGTHSLSMTANPGDSPSWDLEFQFAVEPGSVYFTALWNQNQPKTRTPIIVPIPLPYVIFFVPVNRRAQDPQRLVRIELVPRDQADSALAGLHPATNSGS